MPDVLLTNALQLAVARAGDESRECNLDDVWRALLDDDRSDAVLLLDHLGIDAEPLRRVTFEGLSLENAFTEAARLADGQAVRTDHVLVALAAHRPGLDVEAMRAALAARDGDAPPVSEPAGPLPRLPTRGSFVRFWLALLAACAGLLAAMAALSSIGTWIIVAGVALIALMSCFLLLDVPPRNLEHRLSAGRGLVPVAAPVITDALASAGIRLARVFRRAPGPAARSMIVVSSRRAYTAFDPAMLGVRGSSFVVARLAVQAARRSPLRHLMAAQAAFVLCLACPVGWLLTRTGPDDGPPFTVVLGPPVGLLFYFGIRWWDALAVIRTAYRWAGLPATDAWFDHEAYSGQAQRAAGRRIQWWRRIERPPYRLRRWVWARPAGIYRLHERWHETMRRVSGHPHDRKRWCGGHLLLNAWIASHLTLGDLERRLAAVGASPADVAAELAVWFRGLREPAGGPRTADLATEVLRRAGAPAATVDEVARLVGAA